MKEIRKVAPNERELELKKWKRERLKWRLVGALPVLAILANYAIWVDTGTEISARVVSSNLVEVPVVKNFTRETTRYVLEISGSNGQRMQYEDMEASLKPGDEVVCRVYRSPVMLTKESGILGSTKHKCVRPTGR